MASSLNIKKVSLAFLYLKSLQHFKGDVDNTKTRANVDFKQKMSMSDAGLKNIFDKPQEKVCLFEV